MPKGELTYKRGEIWWIDLEPVVGSETNKQRPCLILQNDVGNRYSSTTVIAPFLKGKRDYPFVVNVIPSPSNNLDDNRHVNLSQLRAVDARRVKSKLGTLEPQYWDAIAKAVQVELGFL